MSSLRARIGAIVIIHALLVYATFLLITRSGQLENDRLYILPPPDKVAAIVLAFERAPPDTYGDLTRAFEDERQGVRLLTSLPSPMAVDSSESQEANRAAIPYRRALAGRLFRIDAQGHDVLLALDRQPYFSREPVRVIVALPNGRAVEVTRYTIAPVTRFITRFRWFGLTIVILDLIVILWLAAQSTAPVERLARAVRHDDLSLLKHGGAREFVELGEAFREMRTRLHASMEERTRIIGAVAHDFRTYLTRLELRSDFIGDERQRALAVRDLEEMRQLMDDALTFAEPGERDGSHDVAIDVGKELEQIVRIRRELGEDLILSLPRETCRAQVTEVAFKRMIANLIDNALRYGNGAARITVNAHEKEVIVCIDDQGPGVPDEQLTALMEPFRRLETSRARHTGGVGLGLSIVQALAHRFGGDLELQNRQEGGLRARLRLYGHADPAAADT
ncbi:hypothetical protein HL653_10965 [Sphingomonas sp. AP4-R1]|uniref:ATP-binding protein n=1 Tax=Sphingomonas sp. AP4-R1 TaxID=2735134 RepID=UPI0014936401|nr:ATP-binding protein [Sphingomonas sp. AP4-R1]QJU58241.1 hypothetical protein HL653_10965 [Sphingomonas sp. AP4-R1]